MIGQTTCRDNTTLCLALHSKMGLNKCFPCLSDGPIASFDCQCTILVTKFVL